MSIFRNETMKIETHSFAFTDETVVRCFGTIPSDSHPDARTVNLCLFSPDEVGGVMLRVRPCGSDMAGASVPLGVCHERVFKNKPAAEAFAANQAARLGMVLLSVWDKQHLSA